MTEEKFGTIIGTLGFLTIVLSAAAMDSENLFIPVAGLLIGSVMMLGGMRCLSSKR